MIGLIKQKIKIRSWMIIPNRGISNNHPEKMEIHRLGTQR